MDFHTYSGFVRRIRFGKRLPAALYVFRAAGARQAVALDLVTGKVWRTDYSDNGNPPILHRKESFVPVDHPRREEFEAFTRAEEEDMVLRSIENAGEQIGSA
jgi:hypothetical protein